MYCLWLLCTIEIETIWSGKLWTADLSQRLLTWVRGRESQTKSLKGREIRCPMGTAEKLKLHPEWWKMQRWDRTMPKAVREHIWDQAASLSPSFLIGSQGTWWGHMCLEPLRNSSPSDSCHKAEAWGSTSLPPFSSLIKGFLVIGGLG